MTSIRGPPITFSDIECHLRCLKPFSGNIARINYGMFTNESESACNLKCVIETEILSRSQTVSYTLTVVIYRKRCETEMLLQITKRV